MRVSPLHGRLEDTRDNDMEMFEERLEMKSFGKDDSDKNESVDYKGNYLDQIAVVTATLHY